MRQTSSNTASASSAVHNQGNGRATTITLETATRRSNDTDELAVVTFEGRTQLASRLGRPAVPAGPAHFGMTPFDPRFACAPKGFCPPAAAGTKRSTTINCATRVDVGTRGRNHPSITVKTKAISNSAQPVRVAFRFAVTGNRDKHVIETE